MNTIILGDGGLGRAIAAALRDRGDREPLVLGRPRSGRHDPSAFRAADLVFEASRGEAVPANVEAAAAGGIDRFVIATTGWDEHRPTVDALLRRARAAAVVAPNLSLGAALFFRLIDRATELFGPVEAFDPYIVEWHRRSKVDRPSGTAASLARRLLERHPRKTSITDPAAATPPLPTELEVTSIRAGASPGMHLVGFDAAGETVELRLTARDRSAYAAGALAAADWLGRAPRPAGIHPFDAVVDELLAAPALAATA